MEENLHKRNKRSFFIGGIFIIGQL